MTLSKCCQARVDEDIMICSDSHCHEHLGDEDIYDDEEETCPDCNGTGEADVIDTSKVHGESIDIFYKKEKCESCKSKG